MHDVGSDSNKFGGDMHGAGCHTNMLESHMFGDNEDLVEGHTNML